MGIRLVTGSAPGLDHSQQWSWLAPVRGGLCRREGRDAFRVPDDALLVKMGVERDRCFGLEQPVEHCAEPQLGAQLHELAQWRGQLADQRSFGRDTSTSCPCASPA
jgi:hypothetical protein